jgi:hypothetical protein
VEAEQTGKQAFVGVGMSAIFGADRRRVQFLTDFIGIQYQ